MKEMNKMRKEIIICDTCHAEDADIKTYNVPVREIEMIDDMYHRKITNKQLDLCIKCLEKTTVIEFDFGRYWIGGGV